jgi:hypothetical protein
VEILVALIIANRYVPVIGRPTKHCTGLPTARVFGDSAPVSALVGGASLADSAAGELGRWALSNAIRDTDQHEP